jgi:hypothetical protein
LKKSNKCEGTSEERELSGPDWSRQTWPEVMTMIPFAFDLLSAIIDPAGK